MMAFIFIETNYSFDEVKGALDAAYNGVVDGKVNVDAKASQILQSCNIETVVYGGSTAGLQDIEKDYAGFLNVIKASKDFSADSPGVPLIYRFRHLSDNTLALVTLTSQYTMIKPLRLRQRIRISIDQFVCTKSNDEADNVIEMKAFSVTANAFNRLNDNEAGSLIGTENQMGFNWYTSNYQTMRKESIFDCKQREPRSIEYVFDTEHYDFNKAIIKLKAYAREHDPSSDDEVAFDDWEIAGSHFLDDNGVHKFILSEEHDFSFRIELTISLVNLD